MIAPIIFENKTVAVLEIAALTRWAPYHFEPAEGIAGHDGGYREFGEDPDGDPEASA